MWILMGKEIELWRIKIWRVPHHSNFVGLINLIFVFNVTDSTYYGTSLMHIEIVTFRFYNPAVPNHSF